MRKLLAVLSAVFSLGNAVFVAAALGDLISGTSPTAPGVLVGLLVFFTGMTAMSGYAALRLWRGASAQAPNALAGNDVELAAAPGAAGERERGEERDLPLEAAILKLAAAAHGRVTAAEVALGAAVSLDEATAALDALCARGHADMHTAPSGAVVYVIAGLLSEEEKLQAQAIVAER